MKKLLMTGLLLTALQASAVEFYSQSFFNSDVRSIQLLAGAVGATNGTTWAGNLFTNSIGVRCTQTNNIGSFSSTHKWINFFKDVDLWALTDGSPAGLTSSSTNAVFAAGTPQGYCNISYRIIGSGANFGSAVSFEIVPLPDGVNESTIAGDKFTFTATGTGLTPAVGYVNVPMYLYIGVPKLRCKAISNADADTAGYVTELRLNGFIP